MKLDWSTTLGILSLIVAIPSLIYGYRSDRRKLLLYEITPPLAIASVLSEHTGYRLFITYDRPETGPINIMGAYVYFVRLGNLGKESVKRDDLIPTDPLRLEVRDAKVLDISKVAITREVTNFLVDSFEENSDNVTTSKIFFDFMDHKDGSLIRILTDSPAANIRVAGTVIGMPQGIIPVEDLGTRKIGIALVVSLILAASAGFAYAFRILTRNWRFWPLIFGPIFPLFIWGSLAILFLNKGITWPRPINLPKWVAKCMTPISPRIL